MSQLTRPQLVALLNNKVLSGGNQTTALKLREFLNEMITSMIDIIDDKDQNGGYLGINTNGIVDVTKIAKVTPTGQFLRDDGSWQTVASVTYTGSNGITLTANDFTNDLITGKTGGQTIIGGTAVTDYLAYKGTTGNGTLTSVAHQFLVGNNGATTAMSIYNSGKVLIGTTTLAGGALSNIRFNYNTGIIDFGEYSSGRGSIWFNQSTPSSSNFSLTADTSGNTIINGSTGVFVQVAGGLMARFLNTDFQFLPSTNNGSIVTPAFIFTAPTQTNVTASTNVNIFRVSGVTKTWQVGTLATQYFNYFSANTVAFASASTATNVYGAYFESAIAGTNATITNNWSIGTNGDAYFLVGTSTSGIKLTGLVGTTTQPTIYFNQLNPSAVNYTLSGTAADTYLIAPSTTGALRIGSGQNPYELQMYGSQTSGAYHKLRYAGNSNTNTTASTEISDIIFYGGSRQWATGGITTQRAFRVVSSTYTAVGASIITTAYGAYFEAPTASTNITITNNYAAGFAGNIYLLGGSNNMIYSSTNLRLKYGTGASLIMENDASLIVATIQNGGFSIFRSNTAPTAYLHIGAGAAAANAAPLKFTSGTNLTTAEAGAVEYNGNNFYVTESSLKRKALVGCIYTQTTSVIVANSVAETSLLTSTTTLPANFFVVGKTLKIKLSGYHSAVSNPNGTVIIKLGSTTIVTTGAVTVTNGSNDYYEIIAEVTCRTTGVTGTVIGSGKATDLNTGDEMNGMVNTAAVTIDTTAAQVLDVTWTWGTASASNTITMTNGFIEILN